MGKLASAMAGGVGDCPVAARESGQREQAAKMSHTTKMVIQHLMCARDRICEFLASRMKEAGQ